MAEKKKKKKKEVVVEEILPEEEEKEVVKKAVWKGAISFGLVNIPVSVRSAYKEKGISFKLLHSVCLTPLKYKRWCEKCKKEVPWNEVVKGYEIEKGKFVPLSKEELEALKLKGVKAIEIVQFAKKEEIDPIYYKSVYFLKPEAGGEKALYLLKEVLKLTNKVAIGKFVLRNKEHLAMITPYRDGLLLITLYYPRELVKIPKIEEQPISEEEFKLAKALVDSMTKPLDLKAFKDRYREALEALIEEKIKTGAVKTVEEEIKITKDLLEALKKSLEKAKSEQ